MAEIYHMLDEAEPFSEFRGGAISRWVANVLRDGDEKVICQSFDDSWGYPPTGYFVCRTGIGVIRFTRRYTDRPG